MSVELTEPQLRALDTGGDTARFIDPRTQAEYRLVPVRTDPPGDDLHRGTVARIARRNAVGRAADES